jgi:hypothetical protein
MNTCIHGMRQLSESTRKKVDSVVTTGIFHLFFNIGSGPEPALYIYWCTAVLSVPKNFMQVQYLYMGVPLSCLYQRTRYTLSFSLAVISQGSAAEPPSTLEMAMAAVWTAWPPSVAEPTLPKGPVTAKKAPRCTHRIRFIFASLLAHRGCLKNVYFT